MKTQFRLNRFHSPDDMDDIWQMLYPEHFINVLLIHHLKQRTEEDTEKLARIMRDGLMHYNHSPLQRFYALINDQSFYKPYKIYKISDIFEPFQSEVGSVVQPKLILIDGAPGMGKTTLCKEIAYQWANRELLTDTKMIFLLFLRDPAIQRICDLKDFIHYTYNFDPLYSDLSKQCAEILTKRNNSDITILMDGYDEYSNKGNDLLIENIIKRRILPQCRIVITSRPIASEKIQRLADVRVEVLGFTDESKREYIEKELKDYPEKITSLISYLNDHSDINQLCYIPIMMTIMVCSFKQYEKLPTNQSELYTRFITLAISHYLQRINNKLSTSVFSLDKLQPKYQIYLQQLSKFAFETIESDKIIFNDVDIQRLSPNLALSSEELQGLGLFKATKHFDIEKMCNCVWYNFLHLSIHEFLAAYYLKSLEPHEQFKILKKTFFIKRYTNVWVMIIGLNQNMMCYFHQFLTYGHIHAASDATEDQIKLILQKLHSLHYSEIKNININNIKGTFQYVSYRNNKDHLQTHLIHDNYLINIDTICLFPFNFMSDYTNLYMSLCSIDNSNQLIEIYFLDKNVQYNAYYQAIIALEQNQNLSVLEVGSNALVGYRCNYHQLTNALDMNGLLETVIFRNCLINDDIANILSSYFTKSHYLKHLHIVDCKVTSSKPPLLVLQALKKHSKLKVLNLNGTIITEQVAEKLVEVIKNNLKLEQFGLQNSNLGHSLVLVLQALTKCSKLEVLNLSYTNITEQAAESLAKAIKNNSGLEALYLTNNDLRSSATVILQALKENSKLKVLNLNDNNMTGQVANDLANVIKNNSGLEELYLSNNDLRSSATVILQALKENSQLKALNLGGNNMTGQVAEDLANVIKNNSGLEKLCLSNNDLRSSATVILQALKENSQLKVLNLNDNNMTGQVAEDLANVIKNNSGLQELCLYNNDLRSSATVFLQALKENSQLKLLNLNDNSMTGQVAEDLANVIKNNFYLNWLGLQFNNLGPSATVILQALKENSQLKALNLGGNNMTGQVAEDLANVIKNNSGLEKLYLFNNDLRSSATVILQALKENSQLKALNLNSNNMTGQVAEDLANVIKNNSGLEKLYLSNNNLRSSATVILQALKENSQLKALNLNDNNMTGQVAEELANVIKNNSGLEELHLYNNDLRSSAIVILQALKENSQLKALNLNGNNMTGQVAEDLANVIKNNSGLEGLHLYNNDLRSSATVILQALKENSQLKVLNLNGNNMTGQVAEELANVIKNNSGLEELYLYNNDLRSSATVILQALKENSQLKALNLGGNNMTGQVAEELANVIKNNSGLEELYLYNNDLRSSATVILQALKENSQLKALNLNGNNMTGQVAEDLANVIKNNSGLEELYLFNNDLRSSATVILQALKENSQLKVLDLNDNNMTGQVAEDLANVIKNNSGLEELYLFNNDLRSSATVILQALKENSQLKVLNLNINNMTGQVAEELANVIKNNSGLEELHLSNNDLRSSATVILQALKENSQLKVLNLSSNKMTGQVAEVLANVIKKNSRLEELYLYNNDLRSSATVILQALKENCKLKILSMSNDFLTEATTFESASVIKRNPLITEIWLGDNMLQSGLVDIAMSCNSLTNLQAMGLSHNSINSTKVVYLASVVSNINSLQALIFGGLILNVKERFHLDVFQFHDANKQTLMLQNDSFNVHEMLEIVCLEIWRSQFVDKIKLNYGSKNCFYTVATSSNMHMNFVYFEQDLRTMLSIVKQSKQQLSELDPTNMIISLYSSIKTLKVLDLGYNNINKEAAVKLAESLNCNNVLEQLWLRGNVLGADGAAVILASLQNISTLRILDLSYNNIGSTSANGIAAVINSNQFLEQLWLDGNILMTAGVIIIASVLKKHSNLRLLSLSNNGITEDAAEEISAIVNNNTLLGGLLLSNNQLQSIGIYETAKSLGGIECLHILELTNNCIDATAADKLAVTLSNFAYLKELYLGNNNLEATGTLEVCRALKSIHILEVLSLNNNNISTEAASEICNVICTNTNLTILLLGDNDLQTTGVQQIADTVKNNNLTMQLLSLSNNNVDEQIKEDIKVMLCDQCDLKLFV